MNLPWISKIGGQEEYNLLVKLANEDNHSVMVPTHIIKKGTDIVGYTSIGTPGVPLVLCWMDSKKILPRESAGLLNVVENHVALGGANGLYTPVLKSSPFYPHMERFGYTNCGTFDLFLKNV